MYFGIDVFGRGTYGGGGCLVYPFYFLSFLSFFISFLCFSFFFPFFPYFLSFLSILSFFPSFFSFLSFLFYFFSPCFLSLFSLLLSSLPTYLLAYLLVCLFIHLSICHVSIPGLYARTITSSSHHHHHITILYRLGYRSSSRSAKESGGVCSCLRTRLAARNTVHRYPF